MMTPVMMLEKKTVKLINLSIKIELMDVMNLTILMMVMKEDINLAVKLILQKLAVN